MSLFINAWMNWSHLFSLMPHSDYVAAFVLVALVVFSIKRVKSMLRYV